MADPAYKVLLTEAGRALQARAHSLGVKVILDTFSTGDGGGEEPTPTGAETALIGENWRGEILSKKQDPNNRCIVTIKTTIPADVGGFYVREFGVWAQNITETGEVEPDNKVLFAYGNHAAYYKALPSEGQSTTHDISIPLLLTNTADVTIQVVKSDYEPSNFLFPTGCILAFAGITTPDGWLWCNGDAVSRSVYAALFEVIGTKYGAGDGETTFNLPDFRERVPEGGKQLDDLRYIAAGLPTMVHSHEGTADSAGEHGHTVSTNTTGNHSHNRGNMNISGAFSGVGQGTATLSGAFFRKAGNKPSQGVEISNGGEKDDFFGFDANRAWTGNTNETGNHSHTGTAADNGIHEHNLTIADNADTGLYGKSDTVQMAACTCNYMIKF